MSQVEHTVNAFYESFKKVTALWEKTKDGSILPKWSLTIIQKIACVPFAAEPANLLFSTQYWYKHFLLNLDSIQEKEDRNLRLRGRNVIFY